MRNHSSKRSAAAVSPKQSPAIPNSGDPSSAAARVKSFIRNILLTSPEFPGLYEKVLVSEGYNPNEAKIIAERYQKKMCPDPSPETAPRTCTHIKVTGLRCGSPALRGERFCYFHQRMVRGVRTPPNQRLHPIALIENEEAIQASLMEVMNALARNTIDPRRAELMLRALNAAIRNVRRVRFGVDNDKMVRQVPEYPAPPAKPRPATTADPREAYGLTATPAASKEPHAPANTNPAALSSYDMYHISPFPKEPVSTPAKGSLQKEPAPSLPKSTTPTAVDASARKPPAGVRAAPPPQKKVAAGKT